VRFYPQRPVGVWRSTPARRLLWATVQTLHHVTRAVPEQPNIAKWSGKIEDALNDPVQEYDWEGWYASNVEKDDEPNVPDEVFAAWEALPEDVRDELWKEAGEVRTTTEGLPFDPDDMAKALDAAFKDVKGIPETQKAALRNMMKLSLEQREGQFKFADRIRAEWAEFSKKRAGVIAITEWNRAASTATLLGFEKTGVERKMWFTVGDARVCGYCEANVMDGEIPIAQPFTSGDDAPPAHPGCRCNISSA
jgi:SPP1 gp7 family putative phage head morphogenesis protein